VDKSLQLVHDAFVAHIADLQQPTHLVEDRTLLPLDLLGQLDLPLLLLEFLLEVGLVLDHTHDYFEHRPEVQVLLKSEFVRDAGNQQFLRLLKELHEFVIALQHFAAGFSLLQHLPQLDCLEESAQGPEEVL